MNKMISKKWLAALVCFVMLSSGALAETYRYDDEADEIATIQTALTTLKLYSGSISGHFGSKTEEAVKKFQKRYALTADGIVGEDTLKALYEAAGIDADTAGTSGASSTSSASSSGDTALLKSGSRNEAVRQLQQDLTSLGYYSGNVSGHFGSLTKEAVVKFQKTQGLTADGVVGSKTLAKIEALKKNASGNSSSGSSASSGASSSSSSSSLLKYGVKGSEAVKALQQNLKALGYYKTGSITGNYGNLTKDAVMKFQVDNGLTADGVAGSKTLAKITSKLSGSSSSGSSGSSSSSSAVNYGAGTLYHGMKNSSEVKQLQQDLSTLGYYSGNKTGNFGDLTKDAVVKYQKSKGLTADGVAGKKTLSAIQADLNKSGTSTGSSSSSGSASSGTSGSSSLASRASNVQFSNFSNWRRKYKGGEIFTVFDPVSGLSWNLSWMSADAHLDAEPATAQDTAIMNRAFGNEQSWTPKLIWATFSDGTTYIGTTHNVPHTPYHNTTNNFDGHLCVHFPRPMKDAEATGPYATSHQEAILEGWEYTKSLMK